MQLVLSASYPTKSPPPARSWEPQQAASARPVCVGGVRKNNSMLSPKLLLCLPLCHKLHVTSHSRESIRSVTQVKPRSQSSVLPSLSDDQATYLLPAEQAVPTESSSLSGGLSGSRLLEHLPGAEPFSRLGQRGSTDVSKPRESAGARAREPEGEKSPPRGKHLRERKGGRCKPRQSQHLYLLSCLQGLFGQKRKRGFSQK